MMEMGEERWLWLCLWLWHFCLASAAAALFSPPSLPASSVEAELAVQHTHAPATAPLPFLPNHHHHNPHSRHQHRPSIIARAPADLPTVAPAPAPAGDSVTPPSSSSPAFPHNASSLDPTQLSALLSLGIHLPSNKDACSTLHDILLCNDDRPVRYLLALQLQLCSQDATLTTEALSALQTLKALSFLDCPMLPVHVPSELLTSLTSFSCVASLGRSTDAPDSPPLPGTWLGKFHNLTDIIVSDVYINASGLSIIVSQMKHLSHITISNTNISGLLPLNSWPPNLTTLHLPANSIHGSIPKTMAKLSLLRELDLSGNNLTGHLPNMFSKMKKLEKLVLASNNLYGSIPASLTSLTSLIYLDLSNNSFNGSLPDTFNSMKALRYVDLSHNKLKGPLPFNSSFLGKLNNLKMEGNEGVCYAGEDGKRPLFLEKVPKCDAAGLPIVPPTSSASSPALSPDQALAPSDDFGQPSEPHQKGPRTIVAAVAITLVVLVIIIAAVVLISRCRDRKY